MEIANPITEIRFIMEQYIPIFLFINLPRPFKEDIN